MTPHMRHDPAVPFRRAGVALWAAAMLFTAACSDEGGGGTGTTQDTGGATTDAATDTGTGTDTAASANWVPAMYRLTQVNVTQPSAVGGILSGVINPEIALGRLTILIETSAFQADSGATTFMIQGNSGELNDQGLYEFVGQSSPVSAMVDAEGNFANDTPIDISLPVVFRLTPQCDGAACPDDRCRSDDDCRTNFNCDTEGDGGCVRDVIVPLREVTISGTFSEMDGLQVLRGASLDGAILRSDADTLEIDLGTGDPIILTALLGEDNMDYPEDEDTKTGWVLSARINADQVNVQ